jgi:hypothetical protein
VTQEAGEAERRHHHEQAGRQDPRTAVRIDDAHGPHHNRGGDQHDQAGAQR